MADDDCEDIRADAMKRLENRRIEIEGPAWARSVFNASIIAVIIPVEFCIGALMWHFALNLILW